MASTSPKPVPAAGAAAAVAVPDGAPSTNLRGVRTRERLLDATIACLIEIGYSRTSMQEVCAKAGISRGAQLHHFPTKARLISSALNHLARKRGQAFTEAVVRLPQHKRGIDAIIDLICDGFSGELADAAIEVWLASRTDPELRASLQPVDRALAQDLYEMFRGVVEPPVDDARFREMYWLTLNLARGLAIDRILDGSAERREALRNDWKQLMNHLFASSPAADAAPSVKTGRKLARSRA